MDELSQFIEKYCDISSESSIEVANFVWKCWHPDEGVARLQLVSGGAVGGQLLMVIKSILPDYVEFTGSETLEAIMHMLKSKTAVYVVQESNLTEKIVALLAFIPVSTICAAWKPIKGGGVLVWDEGAPIKNQNFEEAARVLREKLERNESSVSALS